MKVIKKDNGGKVVILPKITLLTNVDWFDILDQNSGKEMYLCTYSYNPDSEIMQKAVSMIKHGKVIIGTLKHKQEWDITKAVPNVKVMHNSHAKMLLIAPDIVYLSSQNIEYDDWYQTTVRIEDKDAYTHYLMLFNTHWDNEEQKSHYHNSSPLLDEDEHTISPVSGVLSNVKKTELLIKNCECKLAEMKNWKTKLTQIKNSDIIVTTMRLPDQEYVEECIEKIVKNNNTFTLIANDRTKLVEKYKKQFPEITIHQCLNIHSKSLIHADKSVWISSQNFGNSGNNWFECAIQIKNEKACSYYKERLVEFLGFPL